MQGRRIGYIRLGGGEQTSESQLGLAHVDRLFSDRGVSKGERPALEALLAFVTTGDTLVVSSMDRLANSLSELRSLVRLLLRQGVRIEFLKERLCFFGEDSLEANLALAAMEAFAEFERAVLRERQSEGIALAKRRGAYRGRKKSLTPEQTRDLHRRVAAGEAKAHLAREFGISRETLYRYLKGD